MLRQLDLLLQETGGSRFQYVLFVSSFFLIALLEVLGVGIIPLFIAALADPAGLQSAAAKLTWLREISGGSEASLVLLASAVLAGAFSIKNCVIGAVTYLQARFIARQQAKLSVHLLSTFMHKPYVFHVERSTPALQRLTTGDAFSVFFGIVSPAAQLGTEALVVGLITLTLIAVNPAAALLAIMVLGAFVGLFYHTFRSRVGALGREQQRAGIQMVRWMTQALSGVKEVQLLGREAFFLEHFSRHATTYSRAGAYSNIVSQLPRFMIETIVSLCIAGGVVWAVLRGSPARQLLPTLGLFGVAAIRLIPSVTRILGSLTLLRFHRPAARAVMNVLEEASPLPEIVHASAQPGAGCGSMKVKDCIELANVSFTYPNAKEPALQCISLCIVPGTMVGFVGSSGAGKSTLVDIILGLYVPSSGSVRVDGRDIHSALRGWQRSIGYVPQEIYIADDTVRRNVAFGLRDSEMDDELVWQALEDARLGEFVHSLPEGLNTEIGERGSRLSGGQRQRIGIARALYHRPSVIVMDEATSALDNETEQQIGAVMQRLAGARTLLIVAHRLNTVKRCSKLFLLSRGSLAGEGDYEDLLGRLPEFQRLMGEMNVPGSEPS